MRDDVTVVVSIYCFIFSLSFSFLLRDFFRIDNDSIFFHSQLTLLLLLLEFTCHFLVGSSCSFRCAVCVLLLLLHRVL